MKLVLSRKGFDLSSGGAPSPILPDGTMFSLPVPLARSVKTYNDIRKGRDESTIVRLVEDLTGGNIGRDALAHLDPDLDHAALDRAPGWRPCFGQTDAAQTHLEGCGVGPGDLFLFFGWFRQVRKAHNGRWAIDRNSPNLHVIFGWLQIGEAINVAEIGPRRCSPRSRGSAIIRTLISTRFAQHHLHCFRSPGSARHRRHRASRGGRAELVPSPPAAHRRRGGSTISLVAPILVPAERNRFTHLQFQARTLVPNR